MLDHDVLLTKLRHYGIVGTPLIWFKSYLTNRAQYVEVNGTCSNLLSIGKGVPQGSILGPLLFMIFINEIHRSSKEFKFITYADDTTIFSSISSFIPDSNRSMANASETINNEINKVIDWLIANKLSLNVNKTKFMVFHYYQRILEDTDIPNLMISGSSIERVSEFDFLGLTMNEFMSWSSHAKKVSNKISRVLGIMNRMKHFLSSAINVSITRQLSFTILFTCLGLWI